MQEWVNDKYVAVGTKCNKLILVDATTFKQHEIPLPPKPPRPPGMPMPSIVHPGCGIHGMSMSPDGDMFAVGGQEASDCQLFHVQQRPGDSPLFTPHQTLVVGQASVSNVRVVWTCALGAERVVFLPGASRLGVWHGMAY